MVSHCETSESGQYPDYQSETVYDSVGTDDHLDDVLCIGLHHQLHLYGRTQTLLRSFRLIPGGHFDYGHMQLLVAQIFTHFVDQTTLLSRM